MIRYAVLLALAVLLAVSGGLGVVSSPPDDTTGSPRLVGTTADLTSTDPTVVVAALEARVDRVPGDHRAWAGLGRAYADLAGQTFDYSYADRAEDAIDRSLEIQPDDNVAALATRASIRGEQHRFVEALELAEAALAVDPYDATALAIRIDSLTQLGRFREQVAAIRTADRRQPGVPVVSRHSYALELRGDLEGARAALVDAASSGTRLEQSHLWNLAADLDRRLGRLSRSAASLARAELAEPDNIDSVVGRARLAVARGHLPRAVAHWERVVASAPLPEHFIEQGELLDHLGHTAEARRAYARSEETVAELGAAGSNVDGERALFLADHGSPQVAVELGAREAGRSRGVHASDAMGWALRASGRPAAAIRYARLATRLGTREPLLWIHRGVIEADLGRVRAARSHLRGALDMDPGMSPWQRDLAEQALTEIAPAT